MKRREIKFRNIPFNNLLIMFLTVAFISSIVTSNSFALPQCPDIEVDSCHSDCDPPDCNCYRLEYDNYYPCSYVGGDSCGCPDCGWNPCSPSGCPPEGCGECGECDAALGSCEPTDVGRCADCVCSDCEIIPKTEDTAIEGEDCKVCDGNGGEKDAPNGNLCHLPDDPAGEKNGVCKDGECVIKNCDQLCAKKYPDYVKGYAKCQRQSKCLKYPWCINEDVEECKDKNIIWPFGWIRRACNCNFDKICDDDSSLSKYRIRRCLDPSVAALQAEMKWVKGSRTCGGSLKCYGSNGMLGDCTREDWENPVKYDCRKCKRYLTITLGWKYKWRVDNSDHKEYCWECSPRSGGGEIYSVHVPTPGGEYCKLPDGSDGTCENGQCKEKKSCETDEPELKNTKTDSSQCPSHCKTDIYPTLIPVYKYGARYVKRFYCENKKCEPRPAPYGTEDCGEKGWVNIFGIRIKMWRWKCYDYDSGAACVRSKRLCDVKERIKDVTTDRNVAMEEAMDLALGGLSPVPGTSKLIRKQLLLRYDVYDDVTKQWKSVWRFRFTFLTGECTINE